MSAYFAPLQLGIGIPGGCEAAVHATRRFVRAMYPGQVLVKLDFTNAFNTLRQDAMFEAVYRVIPNIYLFALQSYSAPSILKFDYLSLSSQVGPQQGDPLRPLLFSMPLQPVLQSLESDLRVGFLDGITLRGELETVARDVIVVAGLETQLGLHLNPAKCEIITAGEHTDIHRAFSRYAKIEQDDEFWPERWAD